MFPSSLLGDCIKCRVLVASYTTLAGLIDVTTGSLVAGNPFCMVNCVCTGSYFT